MIRAANGFLTPLDAGAMLDCLELLAAEPVMAREMGGAGRSFALSNYSDARLQNDIEDLYMQLLGSAGQAAHSNALKKTA